MTIILFYVLLTKVDKPISKYHLLDIFTTSVNLEPIRKNKSFKTSSIRLVIFKDPFVTFL